MEFAKIAVFPLKLDKEKVRNGSEVGGWLQGFALWTMLGLVGLTMLIIHSLPKLTKAVPATLVAILAVTGIAFFGVDTQTVGDLLSVKGPFPTPLLPSIPWTWDTFKLIATYTAILATVGLIESLMRRSSSLTT